MEISKNQFPVVIQAFEITNNKEFFVAEQLVNNQTEVETFSKRYAGKVIKARALSTTELNSHNSVHTKRRGLSTGTLILIILIMLIVIFVALYFSGLL